MGSVALVRCHGFVPRGPFHKLVSMGSIPWVGFHGMDSTGWMSWVGFHGLGSRRLGSRLVKVMGATKGSHYVLEENR